MSLARKNRRRPAQHASQQAQAAKPWPWKTILSAGAGTFVVVLLVAAALRYMDREVSIEVVGTGQRVSALEVQAALEKFAGAGFLEVDLETVQAAAEALAWVDRARVQRAFPARLVITITEQVAAARWGARGLLNTRGELFVMDSRFPLPELPALDGPPGSEWRVAQRYLEVHSLITPLGFVIRSLHMNARGAWNLELANGITVHFGRTATAVRLQRFADVVAPRLQEQEAQVAYVDMRYGNGFVIGWQPGHQPQLNLQSMRESI